ncbi:hypothetical protein HWV62_32011 [Athelia sp. TMB]|nr:hypothetical protein HWV62_32011 [Athelia sp. TMB]
MLLPSDIFILMSQLNDIALDRTGDVGHYKESQLQAVYFFILPLTSHTPPILSTPPPSTASLWRHPFLSSLNPDGLTDVGTLRSPTHHLPSRALLTTEEVARRLCFKSTAPASYYLSLHQALDAHSYPPHPIPYTSPPRLSSASAGLALLFKLLFRNDSDCTPIPVRATRSLTPFAPPLLKRRRFTPSAAHALLLLKTTPSGLLPPAVPCSANCSFGSMPSASQRYLCHDEFDIDLGPTPTHPALSVHRPTPLLARDVTRLGCEGPFASQAFAAAQDDSSVVPCS